MRFAGIRDAQAADKSWEPREEILVKLKDGDELKFLFEQSFPHKTVLSGSLNGTPITAATTLPVDLYQWAAGTGILTDCTAFIKSGM
ncbi:hypothetical protein ASC95_29355 [Pelomonas sp. Root1217]|nr:hypothetical protein ASC95_29355 [Pelomonas sp. Root1217]